MNLKELKLSDPHRFHTDKDDPDHTFRGQSYLDAYAHCFEPLKDNPGAVLEIGVSWGGSIRLWEAYFRNSRIVGVDTAEKTLQFQKSEGRIRIEICDQSNRERLRQIAEDEKPFKLVIDDGSHHVQDIIASFETLWPFVASGGLYVIEDLGMSHNWGQREAFWKFFEPVISTMDHLQGDVRNISFRPMFMILEKA